MSNCPEQVKFCARENHLLPLFVHFICFPLVQMKGRQEKKTKVRVAWKLICRYTILFSIIFNNYSPKWR